MLILTPEQIRKAEERANAAGLTFRKMMENAGKGCADYILKKHRNDVNIVILCGKGKNGGDGFVIARRLTDACKNVTVIKMFDKPSDELSESRKNLLSSETELIVYAKNKLRAADAILKADIIVDAVFGIGFSGDLPCDVREINRFCRISSAVKIAVDLPSGVSVDGTAEDCFPADETLSMLCLKREHVYKPYSELCGETAVIPIGIDLTCSHGLFTLTPTELFELLPVRPFDSSKGTFGKAAIIAGSKNMPGAAVIASKGAASSGAGLVCTLCPDICREIICCTVPECIHLSLPTSENGMLDAGAVPEILKALSSCDSAAIGCGLGVSEDGDKILDAVLHNFTGTLIIDADGINILAKHIDLTENASCTVILTPHPGEMSRLTGLSTDEINANREKTASDFAKKHGVYVLLKGVNTVIAAPDGKCLINTAGSTALSRGGSGDLLTGIIASLSAQGLKPFDSLALSAYLHGTAGEIADERFTPYASTVERITNCLPEAFLRLYESQ